MSHAFPALFRGPAPVILDGGMGTMLMAAGLLFGDPPEQWNVDPARRGAVAAPLVARLRREHGRADAMTAPVHETERAACRSRSGRGFTLLELVLAMSMAAMLALTLYASAHGVADAWYTAGLILCLMFVICWATHGVLYETRPASEQLTWYYMALAVGGSLGGAFVALLAPRVFSHLHEYPVALLVCCGAVGYVRKSWRMQRRQALLLGVATVLAVTNSVSWPLTAVLVITAIAKLAFENRIFHQLVDADTFTLTSLNKTARLLTDELGLPARLRVACGIAGGVILPLLFTVNPSIAGLAFGALALAVVGELLERYLFFTAVAPAKMPGGFVA